MISLRRLSELSPRAKERVKGLMLEELDETLPEDPRLAPVPTADDVGFTEEQLAELLDRAISTRPNQDEVLWCALKATLEATD